MLTITDLLSRARSTKIGSDSAVVSNNETATKLEEKMKEIEIETIEKNTEKKAASLGYGYVNLVSFPTNLEALALVPENLADELKTVGFLLADREFRMGAINPEDQKVQDLFNEITKKYKLSGSVYMITDYSFQAARKLYEKIPRVKRMIGVVSITAEDIEGYKGKFTSFDAANELMRNADTSDLVTMIIASSMEMRSSDIHIEAEESDIKIRYRIDGVLHTIATIDAMKWPRVISRLKLISGLKVNVSSRPQDGRFEIKFSGDSMDVRVSMLPTAYGESVVMRLLRSTAASLTFDEMGLIGRNKTVLAAEIMKPNGMIITTGPTGSGKTTTLYAILNKLNDSETKIITLEDPIEYKLQGLNQSQIDHSKGYGFADGLRSILRQDPDVVMVGELRDLETADVAINAALTGHLVISTLHTNSAAGTIPRFLAMGVKPFLLAPALNAIIGQRLCRRICSNCVEEYSPDPAVLEKVWKYLEEIPESSGDRPDMNEVKKTKFRRGKGCDQCNGLGYKGRIGIHEVMNMNEEVEKIILGGKVSEYDMERIAIQSGMVLMVQDGLLKAIQGITTIEEVLAQADK